jgi:hypothetical protein
MLLVFRKMVRSTDCSASLELHAYRIARVAITVGRQACFLIDHSSIHFPVVCLQSPPLCFRLYSVYYQRLDDAEHLISSESNPSTTPLACCSLGSSHATSPLTGHRDYHHRSTSVLRVEARRFTHDFSTCESSMTCDIPHLRNKHSIFTVDALPDRRLQSTVDKTGNFWTTSTFRRRLLCERSSVHSRWGWKV